MVRFRLPLLVLAAMFCLLPLVYSAHAASVNALIIQTDRTDYAPGDSVIISGSGFWPNEQVSLLVTNVYNPGFAEDNGSWTVTANAQGEIRTFWIVPINGVNQTYRITASGVSSHIVATTTFTDANSKIKLATSPADTLCTGQTVDVCAFLTQSCPGGNDIPLPFRKVLFYFNPGNCSNDGLPQDSAYTDANGLACATLNIPITPGAYSIKIRFNGESQPTALEPPNSACDTTQRVSLSSSVDCKGVTVALTGGLAPGVILPADFTAFLCSPGPVWMSATITDLNCDVDTVYTNIGWYGGDHYYFDEVQKIRQLGGTVTQVGGGFNGKALYTASDFVAPINTTSGVAVTLPNFVYASSVANYGTFSNSSTNVEYGGQLLGVPTDLSFTLVGPGGPDSSNGDGSIDFSAGSYITVQMPTTYMTCDGQGVDLALFTDNGAGGTAQVIIKRSGISVVVKNVTIPSSSSGSSLGGVTLDLPDHIEFNQVYIKGLTGTFKLDAVAARTAPSPSSTDVIFNADTAGTYRVIVAANDACGHVAADTCLVTVQLNHAPTVSCGADFSRFLCTATQICFPVTFGDADNNIMSKTLVAGPGTLTGNQVCYTPGVSGTSTFIVDVTDSCGVSQRDTINVTVTLNSPPVANNPSAQNVGLCVSGPVCYTFTASDINGGPLTWAKLSGAGTIASGGQYCFTPAANGSYSAMVTVSDSCGAQDTTSITFNVTINSAPVATDPVTPVNLFQCAASQVCYQFAATDINGGTLTWTKLSGSGTVTPGGQWCFTPVGAGAYSVTVQVADSCGRADTTSLTYNITLNGSPTIAFGADTSVSMCTPTQVCVPYTVSDPQGLGKLTESMVSGYGSIDTANNRVCFTPTTSGVYTIIARVMDSCGASKQDTINVTVSFGVVADIVCPAGPIPVSLCAPGQVCQMLTITPANATVTTSLGTYSGGQLCFTASAAGTYNVQVIATAPCGADTCNLVFNVTIGQAAQISCPGAQTRFLCTAGQICVPVGIMGTGATVTVSPIGTYNAGDVCFQADTSGHYVLKVKASTSCGSDSCNLIVDVTLNSRPVAVDPPATKDTFVCASANICRQFSASDVNGGTLTWARLSGAGTVSAGGQWCFTAGITGAYTVVAKVSDSCGAADTVTMSYNVTLNAPPAISLGNDTSIHLCAPVEFCRAYTFSDPNSNVQSIALVSGPGVLKPTSHELCFTPTVAGTYTFIVSITDSCSASSRDTLAVTVSYDQPPVANAGADQVIFQCSSAPICWPAGATDPDNNLSSVQLVTGPPGAYYSGGQICFTPTQTWNYEFVLKATDACGLTSFDTSVIYYTLNSKPVVNAGPDKTFFQCSPTQICLPATATDADGNLSSASVVSGPGNYDGTNICFTPSASGIYTIVLQATDACGATARDTVNVTVTINTAPTCNVPRDTTIFQCTPTQVCLPVGATDVNNNLQACHITSGPGSLVGGSWCYTPASSQVVSVTVQCTDSCGASCTSTFSVEFKINQAPSISFATYSQFFLCSPQQICVSYTASDPNDPRPRTVTLVSGTGTLDTANNRVCFTPGASGIYRFIARVTDECGLYAQDTIDINVRINTAPAANAGPDQSVFLCGPTQICWPATCTDPDNNLTQGVLTGPGTYSGSQICFTPTASGIYTFILRAEDACYAASTDTARITVTINQPPTIAFGNDTSIFLCAPQQLCFGYTVSDPNGLHKIVESMVSGFGSLDTTNNRVCFTPTSSGTYQFIVRATDSCSAFDDDTLNVTVSFGEHPHVSCPPGPINISYCAADSVCYALPITPAGAAVTVSQGVYRNGELCFYASASGTYNVRVIAANSCGADTCNLTFNVTIGVAAQISCPGAQNRFLCSPDSVRVPVTVMGTNPTVTVTPAGVYANGAVSFLASTSGVYNLTVIATTMCGADTCQLQVTVKINRPPVAINPPAVVDTFLCAGAQICRFFAGSDPDSTIVTWARLSGAGTVSSSGQWCFTANASGSYSVVATVSDSCGAKDTVAMTYNVTLNGPPVVQFGNDTTIFQCATGQICLPYTVTDPNNGVKLEQLLSGSGTIDTATNTVCFTPAGAGTYTFIVKATDNCDVFDVDTINVTIGTNHPPTVNAGVDKSVYQCTPAPYCFGITVGDVDNNLDSVVLVAGPGSYANGNVCFTPTQSGQVTFIVRAVDKCHAAAQDTVRITVQINAAPVCQMPHDTTKYFQCVPTQVSLPVTATDINGNFDHCELLSGPGSLVGGHWVYTPSGTQTVKVKIQCVDSCGAACVDSFYVKFTVNTPPVANAGRDTSFFLCTSGTVCVPVSCSDVDGNLQSCEMTSTVGTYNAGTGMVCMTADYGTGSSKIYPVIMKATDSCGIVDYDTSFVTINFNHPPAVQGPPNFTAFLEHVGEVCFDVSFSDPDINCPIDSLKITPVGTYNASTHQVCFLADTTGTYCLTVSATDHCGARSVDTVCIDVQIDQCIHVQIEKTHGVPQGQHNLVNIYLEGSGRKLGGFDFLIAYDPTALTAVAALPGSLFTNCGWEYFTYRFGPFGNCGSGCPSGMLRIDGVAETNNGAYHPSCYLANTTGPLATIDFLVSNDRSLECQFVPVSFFWIDCGDNAFSSIAGDTMFVSRRVYTYEHAEITNHTYGLPGWYGTPNQCLINAMPGKPSPMRCVDFTNGGVDIICSDSIDARGDINLNGMAYEVADAVMFTNYFIHGLSAFGTHINGSVAATDVNGDGLPLTVADLVYLIRVVVGDAPPTPKPNADAINSVSFSIVNGNLLIDESSAKVGAVYLQLDGRYEPKLAADVDGVDLFARYDGSVTRVLVTSKGKSPLGSGAILNLDGARAVKSIEVGSFDGYVMNAKLQTLPQEYSLSQNYPNPFNPVTTIEFALPRAGDWQMDVYNILGQVVQSWSDHNEAGYYKIQWDASRRASGVYFYRLTAGAFSSTKKMVLLK